MEDPNNYVSIMWLFENKIKIKTRDEKGASSTTK
jgi:hypothetical protein